MEEGDKNVVPLKTSDSGSSASEMTDRTREESTSVDEASSENDPNYSIEDGVYIYTDPSDGTEYSWDSESHDWVLRKPSTDISNGHTEQEHEAASKNHYVEEDGTYVYVDTDTNVKYSWDAEKKKWKSAGEPVQDPTVSSFENCQKDGDSYIYTNKSTGAVYRWDTSKHEWFLSASTNTKTEDPVRDPNTQYMLEDGVYVYTDKTSGIKYKWDKDNHSWVKTSPAESESEEEEEDEEDKKKHWKGHENWDKSKYEVDAETGAYIYRDENDGTVYEWDDDKNAWFPKVDEEFLARYQLSYGVDEPAKDEEVKPEADVPPPAEKTELQLTRKRKAPKAAEWFEVDESRNTKVYVTGLPTDLTEEEFVTIMSRCGMVMKDPRTNKMKIKLYRNPDGGLKGDAICTYIKVESVDLALNILDGSDIRGYKINVEPAKFELKGKYDPKLKPKKLSKKEKEKIKKTQEKLFEWKPELRGQRGRHEKVVVLKNLFDASEIEKNAAKVLELSESLRQECGKYGVVKKVSVFDRHEDGVAQVFFKEPEEADFCIQMMNRRMFGNRRLIAHTWDGKTKYRIQETEEEYKSRLSNWDKYLEEDEAKKADKK